MAKPASARPTTIYHFETWMASSASTASSPGPSVSQRGSIRRGSSQVSISGRARANSNASSITVNSNLTSTSNNNLRPFKARRQPKHLASASPGSRPAAITELASESLLERVSRPEDVDLLALSHDSIPSLFAQFSVREVRQIQETAQSQAALKQQELRSMVGERYRDLLGAADSIVRMRVSSQALLGYLNSAREDCTRHHQTQASFTSLPSRQRHQSRSASVAAAAAAAAASKDSEPVHHTLAMLIKLLLDAPEHIWRSLENQDPLSAARLAILARVVYRELASMSLSDSASDDSGGYDDAGAPPQVFQAFPIVERQWDGLDQLANQIVRRAKVSLQRWQASTTETAHVMTSILLLDNPPLESLLDILLAQRHAVLSDVLLELSSGSTMSVKARTDRMTSALDIITTTLLQASHLMQPASALFETIDQLQAPHFSDVSKDHPASHILQSILHTLPNAHILLRYLPSSVTTFTPFIDTSAPPTPDHIQAAVSAWFDKCLALFQEGLSSTCANIHTAAALAQFKTELDSFLDSRDGVTQKSALAESVQETCLTQLQQIYASAFTHLNQAIQEQWRPAIANAAADPAECNASTLSFAHLPIPSTSTVFDTFEATLTNRLSGRSKYLDQCLSCIEILCKSLAGELRVWFEAGVVQGTSGRARLLDEYRSILRSTVDDLVESFRGLMDSSSAPLFMLRLWLALAKSKDAFSLLTQFNASLEEHLVELQNALNDLQKQAISAWVEALGGKISPLLDISAAVLRQNHPAIDPQSHHVHDIGGREVAIASQPSSGLSEACTLLARQLQQVDAHVLEACPDLPHTLLERLQQQWSDAVSSAFDQGTPQPPALQLVLWDYNFLDALLPFSNQVTWKDEILETLQLSWQGFQEAAAPSIQAYRMRTQNLYLPLRPVQEASPSMAAKASALLPLGAAPTAAASSAASSSSVPKVGARFGLLPVSSF